MDLNVASHQASGYTVATPVYEGPLDLLLQLIEHAELDITALALARQLRIYKRFKELAFWLDERENRHLRTYLRVAPPPKVEGRLDLSDITIADLLLAAEEIFAEEAEKQALGTVISAPRVTIREKIAWIAERLGKTPHTTFTSLLDQKPTRLEVVVTFLALLELVKRYRVSARQEGLFNEIEIDKMEDWGNDEDLEIEFE